MFSALQTRLNTVFETLKGHATLNDAKVDEALREIRVALLEADVSLSVVQSFVETVKQRAVGAQVTKSVTPGQQVVKIVHDTLIAVLKGDGENSDINLRGEPPVAVMVVGLQGSGKTTSTAKVANFLTKKNRRKVLMASLDTQRPAAQEQLAVLGQQISVDTVPIIEGQAVSAIADRAMQMGKFGGYDVVLLDTAGRLSIDQHLMQELSSIKEICKAQETLLVSDAMSGQDSVTTADNFHKKLDLTGIILTRVDGDARGGAALSMRSVTGCPIKYMGVGEKVEDLEIFDAERVAGRILGMGDVVSLVEKAQEATSEQEAERLAKRMVSGKFDLEDLKAQLLQMRKMGGISSIMNLLPGAGKIRNQMAKTGVKEDVLVRQEAIINSMTRREKKNPKILHASRKRRIASGSGTSVQDVNKLLKQFQTMEKVMKRMGKVAGRGNTGTMATDNPLQGMDVAKLLGGNTPKGFGF